MKNQRPKNQAIENLKDMRDWSVKYEELEIQRRSEKYMKWTLIITAATLLVSLITLLITALR